MRLPGRIATLAGAAGNNTLLDNLREMATTEAYDVPCPSPTIPREYLNPATPTKIPAASLTVPAVTYVDLLYEYLSLPRNAASLKSLIDFVPRELLAGGRMDLNRPFGDGTGTVSPWVDPPTAVGTAPPATANVSQFTYSNHAFSTNSTKVSFDWSNGRAVTGTGTLPTPPNGTENMSVNFDTPRTRYARDLYLMATLFSQLSGYYDPSWDIRYSTLTATPATTQKQVRCARALAQWAVNVVDYRDRDSIMTCFVYDPDPFGSIPPAVPLRPRPNFNGGPMATRKRPTRARTECRTTLGRTRGLGLRVSGVADHRDLCHPRPPHPGYHERVAVDDAARVDGKNPNYTKPNPLYVTHKPADPDPDFDQVTRPQGSLFVELYNPANPSDGPAPELETYDATNGWSVNLYQKTPGAAAAAAPVWRLMIVAPISNTYGGPLPAASLPPGTATVPYHTPDPDDPVQAAVLTSIPQAVRYAYFVTLTAAANFGEGSALRYYPSSTANLPPGIPPGRYALIGPGQPLDATLGGTNQGVSTTCLSFNSDYPLDVTTTAPKSTAVATARGGFF